VALLDQYVAVNFIKKKNVLTKRVVLPQVLRLELAHFIVDQDGSFSLKDDDEPNTLLVSFA
jgi:hypothetical protein